MSTPSFGLSIWASLWHKSAVPVFLERFILPICAVLIVAIAITNPMNFDLPQRISGSIALPAIAYFVSHTVHVYNEKKPKVTESESSSSATAVSSLPPLSIPGEKLILGGAASKQARWVSLTINTAELSRFAKDYSLMLIVRVMDNHIEALTDPGIEKSSLFTITGEIRTIQVDLSEDFIGRSDAISKRHNEMSLQLYLVLIPKRIRAEQILNLTDVTALGGQQLQSHPSPEIKSSVPFQ